jgi:hypothetical protein
LRSLFPISPPPAPNFARNKSATLHIKRCVECFMPGPAYYRKQAELMARLALANISDPELMDRYNNLALDYLAKVEEAKLGPMPPPGSLLHSRRRAMDHD